MILKIILSIVYIILYGLIIIDGTWAKSGIGERPMIYCSQFIKFILNISIILWLAISIVMIIFVDWKLTLILFFSGFILGKNLYYKLSEWIIIMPIFLMVNGGKKGK